ncbi:LLM class flavin-dependent oxidoreductase [Streptomyces sp. NPDC051105]|uniref:LLM class flavin-dependent oxidoreductase n=1 Tax=Streptomyces sp. NPDC051105 TaxID=3154843 RepID=UPI003426DAB9
MPPSSTTVPAARASARLGELSLVMSPTLVDQAAKRPTASTGRAVPTGRPPCRGNRRRHGYLVPEMTAVGVPYTQRGRRTGEYLDAMRALWTQQAPSYQGRYVACDGIDALPRPGGEHGPRIVIGGHSPAAFRRTSPRSSNVTPAGCADVAPYSCGAEREL